MVPLLSLWLPIVLSAVFVFFASAILHMVLKYHGTDFGRLAAEAEVMAALRPFAIAPGEYLMPHCSSNKDRQYALGLMQSSIWYQKSWVTTFKLMADGLVYAVLTGATLAWFWPA